MGMGVCMGAMCACSFGVAPSALIVTPEKRVIIGALPMATIMDNVPFKNIMPFGMCTSLANPQVAAATAAALGVLTPMPCLPVFPAPWMPGVPNVMVGNVPALNNTCKLICAWGGVVQITNPGTTNVQV